MEKRKQKSKFFETLRWPFGEIILYYFFKSNANFSLIPRSLAQAWLRRSTWRKLMTLVWSLAARCPYATLYQQIWYEIWYHSRPQQKEHGVKRKIQGNSSIEGWMHIVMNMLGKLFLLLDKLFLFQVQFCNFSIPFLKGLWDIQIFGTVFLRSLQDLFLT